ncbi:MAG: hypothetical protein RL757_1928 [Bacteroidota bacterium]|jgi:uncharacterized protein YndB with AHSA1/START domain
MIAKKFSIEIAATPNKIWHVLWNEQYYPQWTAPFTEGCFALSDWKEGSRVHFLSPSGDGMYGNIKELVVHQKMFFTHLGYLKNFEEQPLEDWNDARENYTLTPNGDGTTLTLDMDLKEKYVDFMEKKCPEVLKLVKTLSEALLLTVETTIEAPIETVWNAWTSPEHITKWNNASDDWHTPHAENDLRTGGKFLSRMAAKDGSFSFDFEGTYDEIIEHKLITYQIADGRNVKILFQSAEKQTKVTEIFEPEGENGIALQRDGWQAILNNFQKYVENNR